ncbi:hypothetical protein CYMTET_32314 [Cymbomonas tetramitiformis]|uniref:Uncharacterized protein n=1 Tax=Cymbomonas tetramitiformis TaxID=36881 RepID=A0AAE0KSC2_9CHLO|nr:hypothetical protein CYMTET_32314 [Cymbomonas tetramitiformis]
MVWRRYSHSFGGGNAISYEKQVLAKDRAMAEFGLTFTDLQQIPCSYRSCHGNPYPVWSKGALSDGKRKIAADKEAKLVEEHGAEKLAEMRAEAAATKAAQDKQLRDQRALEDAKASMISVISKIASLRPGVRVPAPLPDSTEMLNKTNAKKIFCLTDGDLKTISSLSGKDLLAAAQRKHGREGFKKRRQLVADKETANDKVPLVQQLEGLEARYPTLKAEVIEDVLALMRNKATEAQDTANRAKAALEAVEEELQVPSAKRTKLTGYFEGHV